MLTALTAILDKEFHYVPGLEEPFVREQTETIMKHCILRHVHERGSGEMAGRLLKARTEAVNKVLAMLNGDPKAEQVN